MSAFHFPPPWKLPDRLATPETVFTSRRELLAAMGFGALALALPGCASGSEIPEGMLAAGAPAQVKKPLEGTAAQFWVEANPPYYAELAQRHLAGVKALED